MTERQVLDIIEQALRAQLVARDVYDPRSPVGRALRAAARRIVSDAQTDQRAAARAASMAGALLTRGRTRL